MPPKNDRYWQREIDASLELSREARDRKEADEIAGCPECLDMDDGNAL